MALFGRLTELGPRLRLQLVKIEEGICEGQVMYHSFVTKTEAELAHLKAMREKKRYAGSIDKIFCQFSYLSLIPVQ